jgi:cellulose synthase/poly-beta-1,6-N-acetylglucosamine synthase-like glycosyltransferase
LLDAELWAMSGGNVARADPAGPVFRLRRRRRPTASHTFVRALNRSDRRAVRVLAVGWAASFVWFWTWWLSPGHSAGWPGLVLNSSLLLYLTVTPAYFLIAALRLRRVDPRLSVPRLRVAFVVTRAPSEPWAVVRPTLEAMLRQDFTLRYDVWLCDEAPDDGILAWCREHRVRVSCRKGVPEYHRATWPRRTRCKEGNLAYFYDHWGYRDYDVVAQLNCDHVPGRGHLTAVVRPFADAAVGYVGAPSVCDANSGVSWAARGRLHREATTHGPLQMGLNGGLGPVCIGSHYAVRTAALREIGGLGPEPAEDFSTTFLLTSAGWHGAFAIDAEAHGDGPLTFADMLTQEFQWSRSLTVLLYELMPHHLHRLDLALRLRFGYALAYYPLLALTIVVELTLPPVAAVTGVPWVDVNYFVFLAHASALPIWFLLLAGLLKRRGLLRPPSAPIFSWEGALFTLTRWPYVVWGVTAAIMQIAGRRTITFKVTPKVRDGLERMSVRLVMPYLAITAVMAVAAIAGQASTAAAGYVFLCILAGLGYGGVTVAVCALHILESARIARVSIVDAVSTGIRPLLAGLVALAPLGFAAAQYPSYAARAFGW